MKNNNIQVFIRAVKEEYADNYLNRGEIYMNTISYFQDLEKIDNTIGDSQENRFAAFPPGYSMHIKLGDVNASDPFNLDNYDFSFIGETPLFISKRDDKTVLHCTYVTYVSSIDDQTCIYFNSKYFEEFSKGYRFFLIHDYKEYVDRICNTEELNVSLVKCGFVKYDKENVKESLTSQGDCFVKRKSYSYQNEYRLSITREEPGPLCVHIGDISDIVFDITPTILNFES